MSVLKLDIVLYSGAAQPGSVRWQTGSPPPAIATDVNLTGCTATASIWNPQAWTTPLVTISTTPTTSGSIAITLAPGAQVPSVVTWTWSAAAVALIAPVVPVDEARLNWGLTIVFPSGGPWPFIRGRATIRP